MLVMSLSVTFLFVYLLTYEKNPSHYNKMFLTLTINNNIY